MNELEMLQEQRKSAWKRVKSSHTLLVRAHVLCAQLERRYRDDEHEYETVDHKLAMLDGRYKVFLPTEKHPRKQRELTLDEIMEVAAKLGISLDNEGITIEGENGLSDDENDSPRLEGVEVGEDGT